MGACEPLLYPIGPSNLEFPLEYDLTICETSSLGICESSSPSLHDFLDAKFLSDEAILEAIITYGRTWEDMHRTFFILPKLETL